VSLPVALVIWALDDEQLREKYLSKFTNGELFDLFEADDALVNESIAAILRQRFTGSKLYELTADELRHWRCFGGSHYCIGSIEREVVYAFACKLSEVSTETLTSWFNPDFGEREATIQDAIAYALTIRASKIPVNLLSSWFRPEKRKKSHYYNLLNQQILRITGKLGLEDFHFESEPVKSLAKPAPEDEEMILQNLFKLQVEDIISKFNPDVPHYFNQIILKALGPKLRELDTEQLFSLFDPKRDSEVNAVIIVACGERAEVKAEDLINFAKAQPSYVISLAVSKSLKPKLLNLSTAEIVSLSFKEGCNIVNSTLLEALKERKLLQGVKTDKLISWFDSVKKHNFINREIVSILKTRADFQKALAEAG